MIRKLKESVKHRGKQKGVNDETKWFLHRKHTWSDKRPNSSSRLVAQIYKGQGVILLQPHLPSHLLHIFMFPLLLPLGPLSFPFGGLTASCQHHSGSPGRRADLTAPLMGSLCERLSLATARSNLLQMAVIQPYLVASFLSSTVGLLCFWIYLCWGSWLFCLLLI